MKDTLEKLKRTVFDEIMKASRDYVLREQLRTELTEIVVARVRSGEINSPEDAEAFINAMKAAIAILETLPFESWKTISSGEGK